jgi:hypothetical protein
LAIREKYCLHLQATAILRKLSTKYSKEIKANYEIFRRLTKETEARCRT